MDLYGLALPDDIDVGSKPLGIAGIGIAVLVVRPGTVDRGEELLDDGLDRLGVQGEPALEVVLEVTACGPFHLAFAEPTVELHHPVPELGCFPPRGGGLVPCRLREAQAVLENGG